jgi:hypothetical protein
LSALTVANNGSEPTVTFRDGLALLTWRADTFGYPESYDEAASRSRGLQGGHGVNLTADSTVVLVKPEVAGKDSTRRPASAGSPHPRSPAAADPILVPILAKRPRHRRRSSSFGVSMGRCRSMRPAWVSTLAASPIR